MELALRRSDHLYENQVVEKQFPLLAAETYRLGVGDVIKMTRLQENLNPETGLRTQRPVSYDLLIEQDGSVQFIELDGRIRLSGQTLEEAQDIIRQELLRSGLSTSVTVNIKQYASQSAFVTGDFGPMIIALRPDLNTADRVILSYLSDQAENTGRYIKNNDDYLVTLSRGGKFFALRLSSLLNSLDRDRYSLIDGDRLDVVQIRKSPKVKVEVEKFESSFITLTQDTPFELLDMEKLSHNFSGSGKTLRIFLTAQKISMYDILSEFGYWPEDGADTVLILERDQKKYRFSGNAIIGRGPGSSHHLEAGDVIVVEKSKNVMDNVYVFGEVGQVSTAKVSNVDRPYLSEVLQKARAFDMREADIRHIYVLRQKSPKEFNAFRFDVSNVVNFGLVEKLEMRPSDIVLVRTLPLYRFNRFIKAVFGIGGNAIGSIQAVVNQVTN